VIADAVRSRRDARTEDVLASDCRTGRSGGVVILELGRIGAGTTILAVDDSGHDAVSVGGCPCGYSLGAWSVSIDRKVIDHYKYRDPESCRSPSSQGAEEKD